MRKQRVDSQTKVVAVDVFGTMLPTKDIGPLRGGLVELLDRFKERGLTLCTCSDADIYDVKYELTDAGMDLAYFDHFFKMLRQPGDFTSQPKDFKPILEHYTLHPRELLVIGDREARDIKPARELGCQAILVPEYVTGKNNYSNINEFIDLK